MTSRNCASFLAVLIVTLMAVGNSGCGGGSVAASPPPPPPAPTFIITTESLPYGAVNTPYSVTLQSSGGTSPTTWGLYAFSLPPGLSLSSSGTISGTPVTPGSSCLVFTATDSSTAPQSVGQELCIAINSSDISHNALLKGQYALVTSGSGFVPIKGGGSLLQEDVASGTFVADGNGNITGGVFGLGAIAEPLTGTYAVGSDNRGTMSITSSGFALFGAGPTTLAFAVRSVSSSGVATKGRIISFPFIGGPPIAGEFDLQDDTAFSNSAINGSYAFVLSGLEFGADGVLTANGTGNIPSGTADQNLKGVVTTNLPLTGTYNIPANSPDGRGTGTVTIAGTTYDFAFYVVSAGKLLVVGSSWGSNSFGQALKQSAGPFSDGSLSGASVFSTMGMGTFHDVKAGLYNFSGSGETTVLEDENNAGSVTLGSTLNASYSVESDGRVTLTTGGSPVSVLYLVSSNEGFILNTDPNAATGFFEPQASGPFNGASINGNFFFGDLPLSCCTTVSSGVATLNAGTISQTSDVDQPRNPDSGIIPVYGQTSSDTYTVLSNGRAATGSGNQVIYIISPKKFLMIDVNSTNKTPVITVAEQ